MKRRTSIVLSLVALLSFCAFIFYMSAQPAVVSAKTSGGIAEYLARLIQPAFDGLSFAEQENLLGILDHLVRKTAHFCEFALMGVLSMNAARQLWKDCEGLLGTCIGQALTGWAFSVLFAISDEIHQLFVPGRAGMVKDVLLDSAGALFGVAVLAGAIALARKRAGGR